MDGERCPEIAHAPRTDEGRAVLAALDRIGVWRRAGMAGTLTGLDLVEAMASLPAGMDADFARRLLLAAEAPFVAAWLQANKAEEKVV